MSQKPSSSAIPYELPRSMIGYRQNEVMVALVEARSTVAMLKELPYQKSWVEELQRIELKREVAGTSRIEGAEFTEGELATAMSETLEQLHSRSQRQARAALAAYRWIAELPTDRPIDTSVILEIHRRMVTGADDDHCAPGQLRRIDQNVTFGAPRHRGVEGGQPCGEALDALVRAMQHEFREHDPLIQALAAHFQFAAMHPFEDGNGRTARALEALMLQRAGLRESCFIAMSNYYYDEKTAYLAALSQLRREGFDLTPFLIFGLQGITSQSRRMVAAIKHELSKGLYRNLMYDLFKRFKTPRRRVVAERQLELLKVMLEVERIPVDVLIARTEPVYASLSNPRKAVIRDLSDLHGLGAVEVVEEKTGLSVRIRLEWPSEITETRFFEQLNALPKAKSHPFLQ